MKITSKIKEYTVDVVDDFFTDATSLLGCVKHNRLFYFIDQSLYGHYKKDIDALVGTSIKLIIPAHENEKEYVALGHYFGALIQSGFQRSDMLVTFGGGILQDISGFIASTLYRGIKWTFVPTTLLAQADSCIGSKTSINFGDSKNLIGTFYPPDQIFIDTAFCKTLNPSYFNSGVGEIIKFHLLSDEAGYSKVREYVFSNDLADLKILKEMIESTLAIKKSYFEKDEFDTGLRNLLNYGHCFGHALESASNFAIGHGEAVLIGMGFANLIARSRGLMTETKYQELEKLFALRYPEFDFSKITADAIITYLKKDKKRVGRGLTMILLHNIGESKKYDDLTEDEVKKTYTEFMEGYKK